MSKFTDFYIFDNSNSDNNSFESGYIKLNFKMELIPSIAYNVDFLVQENRVHISIWIGTGIQSGLGGESAFDYTYRRDVVQDVAGFFIHFSNYTTAEEAYEYLGKDYFNKIVDGSGGIEHIFKLTIDNIFGWRKK